NEARLASSLTHPNIVQVHDLGQEQGAYFMAMDFVAGHDLYSIARKAALQRQPLPPELAAKIVAGACAGLHYAHTKKNLQGQPLHVVHRDVSPANILVSYEGEVRLTDFGIAKAEAQGVKTRTGVVKGKFSYMSPEQIKSQPLDGRSDVFALGITLHEVLTGRRLFRRDSELAVMHDILETEAPPPSSQRPELPKALDAICARALQKDVRRRYQSAQEMQQDLEAFLAKAGTPSGPTEVAAYMLRHFAEEHAAYQDLVKQLDTADPSALAMFIEENSALARISRSDGTGSTGEKQPPRTEMTGTPGPAAPPPRSRSRGPLVALGLAIAAAAAAGTVLYLRPPVSVATISPPPPAAKVEGAVQVDSDPAGARILLDGSPTGLVSPATITPVSFGQEHKLRLERDGFQPKEIAFTLTEQMAQKAVSASLMPVPPPEEQSAAKEPEPEPAVARAGAKAGHAMGTLQLSSDPTAEVLFQKKAMGKTPAKLRLPVGKVELVLVNRELSLTRKVEVEVPRSGVGTQQIAFRKGKLAADVKPWADVYVGAKKLGTTPFAPRELYEGTYVVKLVNSDLGAIKEVQVTVTPGNTTVLREQLP
ncbi:MAG TPA: serine/threonine-protein kinase, partial [Myxococcales bacterium]|nr:serine/threonine-protein kinase [Myxococcales bacterium]